MDHQSPGIAYTPPFILEGQTGRRILHFSRRVIKRSFDIIVAIFGLIIISPVFLWVVIKIKRDSPGPAFYQGQRMGHKGRPFNILKFRTMYECQDSYRGPRVTCKEDDRITPYGRWLRDSKVNEIPQLWNVLIGEMSLVGPRPEDVVIANTWPDDMKTEILSIRPGITSPASILYRDEEQILSSSTLMEDYYRKILPDKMRLDRLYVRNHSLLSDIDIILWTAAVFLPRAFQKRVSEGYLFAGPLTRLVKRHLSWFLLDLMVAFGAAASGILLWRIQGPLNWDVVNLVGFSILMAFLFSGINTISGLNRIRWSEAYVEDAGGLLLSAAATTVITSGLNYLQSIFQWIPLPPLPLPMVFTIGLMASIGFVAIRYRWRLLTGFTSRWLGWRKKNAIIERVLIVGSGEGIKLANWLLRQGEGCNLLSIVGIVDDEQPAIHGMKVKGNKVLGGLADIPRILSNQGVGVVIFAIPAATDEIQEQVARYCSEQDVRIVYLSDLLSILQKQLTRTRANVVGKR